ncbi:chromatin-associated swi6 [Fusarium albosuccineum]|uniref:Chromatin-associated swi6 n=1 Tax=Fusarium albosuccineum TaxID=1237068 RepID=A0A8H4LP47_9HYPO|nr:chromatin-associated swi6 [Fusarium albosuccineum]
MSASRSRLARPPLLLINATRLHRNRLSTIAKPGAALSDEDSSDVGDFIPPPRPSRKSASAGAASDPHEDDVDANGDVSGGDVEGDDDDDDEEEEVYVVERIDKHLIDKDGVLKFLVKWEGWDGKNDKTWEPEENLAQNASEILEEYFERHGGREKIFEETDKASKTKKRRRTTNGTPSTMSTTKRSRRTNAHPASTTPPATSKKWSPPAGSWEDEIDTIDACEDEGSGKLIVYLIWKNGQKTKHDTQIIYKKCPQKMLQFYERHVKIIRDENRALADGAEELASPALPFCALASEKSGGGATTYNWETPCSVFRERIPVPDLSSTYFLTSLTSEKKRKESLVHFLRLFPSPCTTTSLHGITARLTPSLLPVRQARVTCSSATPQPLSIGGGRQLKNYSSPTLSTTAIMKRNDVIAIIIIILFIILAAVSFGIWKLVTMAKNHMSATGSGTSSSGGSNSIAD